MESVAPRGPKSNKELFVGTDADADTGDITSKDGDRVAGGDRNGDRVGDGDRNEDRNRDGDGDRDRNRDGDRDGDRNEDRDRNGDRDRDRNRDGDRNGDRNEARNGDGDRDRRGARNGDRDEPLESLERAWGITERALFSWDVVLPVSAPRGDDGGESVARRSKPDSIGDAPTPPSHETVATNTSAADFVLSRSAIGLGRHSMLADDSIALLPCRGRDIGAGLAAPPPPPRTRMAVDRSTMTAADGDDDDDGDNGSRGGEFVPQLVELFPGVPEEWLRDVYEKCRGDVNWAAELLMECVAMRGDGDGDGDGDGQVIESRSRRGFVRRRFVAENIKSVERGGTIQKLGNG